MPVAFRFEAFLERGDSVTSLWLDDEMTFRDQIAEHRAAGFLLTEAWRVTVRDSGSGFRELGREALPVGPDSPRCSIDEGLSIAYASCTDAYVAAGLPESEAQARASVLFRRFFPAAPLPSAARPGPPGWLGE